MQAKTHSNKNLTILDPEILEAIFTSKDEDLQSLSQRTTIMLIFLRHFGCTFCREAISDIAKTRLELENKGITVVMVHMTEPSVATSYFKQYELEGISHISDPDLSLYEYFGLSKGSFLQLYGLKVWLRGLKTGLLHGYGLNFTNKKLGKITQMPGIFMLRNNAIVNKFVYTSAADRPNYTQVSCCGSSKKLRSSLE